jgi:hypothetical protein
MTTPCKGTSEIECWTESYSTESEGSTSIYLDNPFIYKSQIVSTHQYIFLNKEVE